MKAEDISMGFSRVALLELIKIWTFYFQIIYLILSWFFKMKYLRLTERCKEKKSHFYITQLEKQNINYNGSYVYLP